LRFADAGGLWCAFTDFGEGWSADRIYDYLDVLGDSGIGGERSGGHGQFIVSHRQQLSRPDVRNGRFITLAHYNPLQGEKAVLNSGAAYNLVDRRGWMSSPDRSSLRRKSVKMVAAGGVLRAIPGQARYGRLVDVTPEDFDIHKVWRYGYAFPIGLA
jgi:CRISPR-associated protein Csm4